MLKSPSFSSLSPSSVLASKPSMSTRLRVTLSVLCTLVVACIWLLLEYGSSPHSLFTFTHTLLSSSKLPKVLLPPRVCSHRSANISPLPKSLSNGENKFGTLVNIQSFIAAGVRCFDFDLFETSDHVVHVGTAKDIANLLGLKAATAAIGAREQEAAASPPSSGVTTTADDEVASITSVQLRDLDKYGVAPTLEEVLRFLVSQQQETKSTTPSLDDAPLLPSEISAELVEEVPLSSINTEAKEDPLPPIFVTFEPKQNSLRPLPRLENLVQLFGKFPTLHEDVALIVHDPLQAAALRKRAVSSGRTASSSKLNDILINTSNFRIVQLAFPLLDGLGDRNVNVGQDALEGDFKSANVLSTDKSTDTSSLSSAIASQNSPGASSFSQPSSLSSPPLAPSALSSSLLLEEICGSDFETHPMKHRLNLLQPYDLLMPSALILHACGNIPTFRSTAEQHKKTLEEFLAQPKRRQPERNPIVQAVVDSESKWVHATEIAASSRQQLIGKHSKHDSESVESSSSAKSEADTLIRPLASRRTRLSVWNIDTNLLVSQVGVAIPTRSWSSFHQQSDHDSDRDINSNEVDDPNRQEMRFTPANLVDETTIKLAQVSNDAIPIAFFITSQPIEAEKWVSKK